ncbi:MAG: M48 family metallopeptidase [Phycisphaerales bacterium]
MVQLLLILCIGTLVGHDAVHMQSSAAAEPHAWSWPSFLGTVGPMAMACIITHAFIFWCGRRLDDTGVAIHIIRAERAVNLLRLALAAAFVYGVTSLGWSSCIRGITGDLPAIDELLCLTPVLLGLCSGWASFHAIDRRLREAALMGVLDSSEPLTPLPGVVPYVLDQFRHQVLILLVPMLAISAWSEAVTLGANAIAAESPEIVRQAWASWVLSIAQFAGVILVLGLMPLGLRHVWRTSPLGDGPLHRQLSALCQRQRVRCRGFLVWHTHTGMINGALVGILPWARYILLTDALLERMPPNEVEAVMAHEVGHAARRHIPWMGAAVIVSSAIAYAALTAFAPQVLPAWAYATLGTGERVGPEFPLALIVGLLIFGWVSRRFERQADAFAAQHLSGWSARRPGSEPAPAIDPHACEAMADALRRVARLARIDARKFTFRHGSIASRIDAVRALAGRPADGLPIDRTVRRMKAVTAMGVVVTMALVFFE